jgi:hypothetical protein
MARFRKPPFRNARDIGGPRALPCPRHAPVAQLDRALDYESRGQRFESFRARHHFNDLARVPLGCYRDVTGSVTENVLIGIRRHASSRSERATSRTARRVTVRV